MILISISNQISCYVDELQNYRNKIQFSYHRFYKNAYNWLFKPQSTVWVQKKVASLKLFAIFSLELIIFPWNFASMLPVYIYIYLPILVDLS